MIDGLAQLDGRQGLRPDRRTSAARRCPTSPTGSTSTSTTRPSRRIDQDLCIKCGLCHIACEDTSHQAIARRASRRRAPLRGDRRGMRRLQSLRACLPGAGLHHHGAGRYREALSELDAASEQSDAQGGGIAEIAGSARRLRQALMRRQARHEGLIMSLSRDVAGPSQRSGWARGSGGVMSTQYPHQRRPAVGEPDGAGQDRRHGEGRRLPARRSPISTARRATSSSLVQGRRAAPSRSTRWATSSPAAPGRDNPLPPVMTGSHLDTQPTGGKFDGAYGVMAGLEVVRTLNDFNYETEAPIEVVGLDQRGGLALRAGDGRLGRLRRRVRARLRRSRAQRTCDGMTIGEELKRIGYAGPEPVRRPAGRRLLRGAYRAGADPRGREQDRSASSPGAQGHALVRDHRDRQEAMPGRRRWSGGGRAGRRGADDRSRSTSIGHRAPALCLRHGRHARRSARIRAT